MKINLTVLQTEKRRGTAILTMSNHEDKGLFDHEDKTIIAVPAYRAKAFPIGRKVKIQIKPI